MSIFLMWFADWNMAETDFYQPLTVHNVLEAGDGELYLLQLEEARILRIGSDGRLLTVIGGKGEGPGELQYPMRLFFQKGVLYVLDAMTASVSLFKPTGAFIERIRLSERKLDAVKVANGWIYGDWGQFAYDPEGTAHVWWADVRFQNPVALFEVKGRGAMGTFVNDGVTSVYSPISATPKIAVNREGTRAYVADAQGFKIRVIDPLRKSVVHVIQRKEKTLEFNPDWADVRLNEVKKMMPDIIFKTNYPKHFPVIRSMFVHPNGSLVVDRWTRNPATEHDPLALDPMGNVLDRQWDWEVLTRWVGSHGDLAYVATYDASRQRASIARCPKAQVAAFVRAHPQEIGE